MKKVFSIILFCFEYLLGFSQSHIRLNNYWENLYTINPASITYDHAYAVCLAGRKQWINFPGSPATFMATSTMFLDNINTQLGLRIIRDQIAYTSSSLVNGSYGYGLRINDELKVSFGLAASYQQLSYDFSKASLEQVNDQAFLQKEMSVSHLNADLGFELAYKSYRLGFSSQNLLPNEESVIKNQVNTNLAYLLYRQQNNNTINWGFGVSAFQYRNMFQMEFNATSYLKSHWLKDIIQVGAFYRTFNEMGLIMGLDVSDQIHVSYSYDYNLSAIRTSSIGTHEIMITFKLWRCPTCH